MNLYYKGETIDLQEYLTAGIDNIMKNAVKATITNPAQSIFMAKFALAVKEASKKRFDLEKNGEHIPAFLIASITSSCNLHCAGCYARAVHSCSDTVPVEQLSADEWDHIFEEAEELGISFILLAGGEPMIRRDVMEKAGDRQKIMFPIFTNGTLIDDTYIKMLKKSRNLIPIFSIEGKEKQTDARRGEGVYGKVFSAMEKLQKEKLLFGSSVTVTTNNLEEVTSDEFLEKLVQRGGKNWTLANADPFDGKLGLAEGIEFFTKDNGYIGITDALGTYSQIYVTYNGGSTFSKIELPMDLVKILPETATEKGYTLSDYDYYEMPSMINGKLEINAVTDSSETKGIIFVSDDDGESWKPMPEE